MLKASEDGTAERDAVRLLAARDQAAAVAALKQHHLMKDLPPEKVALVKERMRRLRAELAGGNLPDEAPGGKAAARAGTGRRGPNDRVGCCAAGSGGGPQRAGHGP
ncbi:hypothetical protein [Pseudarthrobacter sp. YAF2]|uniref:hypothetical protein n=1 Tax=Pseudarthrobacter sp. YAF2 TaxID=3233078 RepID=UPI003F9C5DC5